MDLDTRIKTLHRVDPERYTVEIEYDDGVRGIVELAPLFSESATKPMIQEILRGDLFARCFVESGALAWPNGFELCPDALRAQLRAEHERSA